MRYYRHRRKASKRAKQIFLRILFVLAAAALVTGLAILTGNLLLAKVERAEEALESSIPPSGYVAGRDDSTTAQETPTVDKQSAQVFAAGLDLSIPDTEDGLFSRLNTLAQTYNTVSVNITDGTGLLYVSEALSTLVGMPQPAANTEAYTRLTQTVTAAKAQNLRLCAVMPSSLHRLPTDTAALLDSTVAAELYTLGFDEILFTGLLAVDADTDAINMARRYLNDVHDALSGTGSFLVGACLPISVYLDAVNAKQVQMLSSAVDFLAMNAADTPVAGDIALTLEEICTSLTGSFQVYDLRVVLDTRDTLLLAAQYNSLARQGISNIHILPEISSEALATTVPTEEETAAAGEVEPAETIPTTNPYITTRPSDGSEPANDPAAEPEETYYRTEGGSWF